MTKGRLRMRVVVACLFFASAGCFGGRDEQGAASDLSMRYAVAQERLYAALCHCGVRFSPESEQCAVDLVARHADVIGPWAECSITLYNAMADCVDEQPECFPCPLSDLGDCGELPPEAAAEVGEDDPPPGPYADCVAAERQDARSTRSCGSAGIGSSGNDPGFSGGSSLACPLELIGQMSVPGSATDPCDQQDPACSQLGGVAVNCCMPTGEWMSSCTCKLPGANLTCGASGIIDATASPGAGCSVGGGPTPEGTQSCETTCDDGIGARCTTMPAGSATCRCTQGPRAGQQFQAAGCTLDAATLVAECGS